MADPKTRYNETIQYNTSHYLISTFPTLREKFPEKYETYADIVHDEWVKLKIVVEGRKVKLYVNNQSQPT
jgi:hypothetical protein